MENNPNSKQSAANNTERYNSGIFRAKSLERISSPEDLNDYVRMTNPGVWMILIAVILILAGAAVWGILGSIDTTVPAVCVTENGETKCYISENYISKVREGMTVTVNGEQKYTVCGINHDAVEASAALSEYAMHTGGFTSGEWLHILSLKGEGTPDEGADAASVTIESIHPIKFILG